jgi:hypothetical protein
MADKVPSSVFGDLIQTAIVAAVSFIFFFFIFPNRPIMGGALAVCLIGGGMAVRARWSLRHSTWFWITLACVFVVEGSMVFFIPWPAERFSGIMLVPLGLADFAFVYCILNLVHKLRPEER